MPVKHYTTAEGLLDHLMVDIVVVFSSASVYFIVKLTCIVCHKCHSYAGSTGGTLSEITEPRFTGSSFDSNIRSQSLEIKHVKESLNYHENIEYEITKE